MRTETRIGVVVGLAVVVTASVYFARSSRDDHDLILTLAPPVATAVRPKPTPPVADVVRPESRRPEPRPVEPPVGGLAMLSHGAPATPLRTGASDALVHSVEPAKARNPEPVVAPVVAPSPMTVPPAGSSIVPMGPVGPARPSDVSSSEIRERERFATSPGGSPSETGRVAIKPEIVRPAPIVPAPVEAREAPKPLVATDTATWPKSHLVQAGDTLGEISRRYYGDSSKTSLIRDANPQVGSPRSLRIGMKLVMPDPKSIQPVAAPPTVVTPADPAQTYLVRPGDSFYSIAQKQLGDGRQWRELLRRNRELVRGNPANLRVGMTLTLSDPDVETLELRRR